MLNTGLAGRYARALLNAVAEGEAVEKTAMDLRLVLRACAENPALDKCLASPVVQPDAKRKIIDGIFSIHVAALTVDFLKLLLDKRRFGLLGAVSRALDGLIDDMRGRTRVSVTSALPISDSQREYLRARLEKWLKQSIVLTVATNPALLCGMQVRVGDRFYDGSGLGQLARLRSALANT